jgi:tetrahydromethanopterin S-methyltransferase subunit G
MSDTGPDNLTLRHLWALDERMQRIESSIERLTGVVIGRFTGLEGRMLGLETRMAAFEAWSVEVTQRLSRIERRLDLVEHEA